MYISDDGFAATWDGRIFDVLFVGVPKIRYYISLYFFRFSLFDRFWGLLNIFSESMFFYLSEAQSFTYKVYCYFMLHTSYTVANCKNPKFI